MRLARASKWCQQIYPQQIKDKLVLSKRPLKAWKNWQDEWGMDSSADSDDMDGSLGADEWRRNLVSFAEPLARLLRKLPNLNSIELVDTNKHSPLDHVLGKALLSEPRYVMARLSEIKLGKCGLGLAMPEGMSHLLVQAIADGRTPGLRRLVEGFSNEEDGGWLAIGQNEKVEVGVQLAEAVGSGHLPCLTELKLIPGTLAAFWSAFGRRHEDGQLQAMMEKLHLTIGRAEMNNQEVSALKELLVLPCFGKLEAIDVIVSNERAKAPLAALAVYVQHTKGAPCLRSVHTTLPSSYAPLSPRFASFCNGYSLVALTELYLNIKSNDAFQDVGDAFRGGGLLSLIELHFGSISALEKEQMDRLMEGVLASWHEGRGLREIHFEEIVECSTGAGLSFVDALQNGAFPNLQVLQVERGAMMGNHVWGERGPPWSNNEVVKAAFRLAMKRGAPCARTLRQVWLGSVTEGQLELLQRALPQISSWKKTVAVVEPANYTNGFE